MTEEIIIDGVNVAGCEFITDTKNGLVKCTSWVHNSKKQISGHWDCRENKNCYYKQLKRLEQENKELKEDVLKWQKAFSRQYQINENKGYSKMEESYRSALEEIRKAIKSYDLTVDNGASVDTLYTIKKIINEVLK